MIARRRTVRRIPNFSVSSDLLIQTDPLPARGGQDFYERVKASPNESHFSIIFRPADKQRRLGANFTIYLPENQFTDCLPFWREFIFHNGKCRYSIALDYEGFKLRETVTGGVTEDEWLADDTAERKPAIGSGVVISFHRD